MLEPGWKMDYLQKTKEGGVDGGELWGKDGGRAREERWRRSDGNRQREKAESCVRIF